MKYTYAHLLKDLQKLSAGELAQAVNVGLSNGVVQGSKLATIRDIDPAAGQSLLVLDTTV
jgi:hypothetical protein